LNEHVLGLLEFPKVCELLSERAASARGRKLALEIRPDTDRVRIESAIDRVRQMRDAFLAGFDPGPVAIGEIDPLLGRLNLQGDLLQPEEILSLKALLAVSTNARIALDRPEVATRFPHLHVLAARFGDFRLVVRRIDEVFDPSGEFLDTASPTLQRIRQRLRTSRTEAGEALASMARRESSHPEEAFVTLREGRYVLAVRTYDRSRFPGIVHGHSGSGQTVFLEPFQAVERNNEITDLESQDHEERVRILAELSDRIRLDAPMVRESYAAAIDLDLLRARTRLAIDLDCGIPSFNDNGVLRLVAARHPLLAATDRSGGARVVPLDLELNPERRTLVLSGPNMGGKTVALKTVGLLAAMAQAGLLVSAGQGSELPVVDGIYADLGDEQSIEQETSTFAGHLRNMALAWEESTSRSLVLLDELGGGTDPDEGTALGRAIMELLTERGCAMVVTTHLSGLKMVAHEHPGMTNAAMEFDPSTQQPTYRMRPGSPGRSRAFELARRMIPESELILRAEAYRSPLGARLDDLLGDIERKRMDLEEKVVRVRRAEEDLREAIGRKDKQAERLRQRIHAIREARWEAAGAALREAESLLTEARRIRADMERARGSGGRPGPAAMEVDQLRRSAEDRVEEARRKSRRAHEPGQTPLRDDDAHPGVRVYSGDLKSLVVIESEPDASGRVWITNGLIRFHVPVASLAHPADDAPTPVRRSQRSVLRDAAESAPVEREIDVRGRSAEEALETVERYIDRASIAGVPEVRIIHGKGTGTLKRGIEEFLRASPLVEEFRIGEPREGGWGATIVRVRSAQVG
jgi:DNA mismatch repair protein MutS2